MKVWVIKKATRKGFVLGSNFSEDQILLILKSYTQFGISGVAAFQVDIADVEDFISFSHFNGDKRIIQQFGSY